MTHFDSLRAAPWNPTFMWVSTADEAADQINLPHEDYPLRVERTKIQLLRMKEFYFDYMKEAPPIRSPLLRMINFSIFSDRDFAGKWREIDVTVGIHRPSSYQAVANLMDQLELLYEDKEITIDSLVEWYTDFETIHPFQDGNGRVGGIVVAAYTNFLNSEKGWLAPKQ